jgi:diguanylate cyclase (GGDEF)-like protein
MVQVRRKVAEMLCPEIEVERRELHRLAEVDELTGLANRRAFERALPEAERDPWTAVAVFDLNNLGLANKLAGHMEGDARIVWAAEVMQTVASALGSPERCFRIGGDEFVVLCPIGTARELVRTVTEVHGHVDVGGVRVSLGGSWGSTFIEADAKLQGEKQAVKLRGIM